MVASFGVVFSLISGTRLGITKKNSKGRPPPAADNDKLVGQAECKQEKQGTDTLKHI